MSILHSIRGRRTRHTRRNNWTKQKRTKDWIATRDAARGKPVRLADLDIAPGSDKH
jgi:hypothetical protein